MKRTAHLRSLALCPLLALAGCGQQDLPVEHMVTPDYPIDAHVINVQGTVTVSLLIGPDGKVLTAGGVGAHPYLVNAAVQNVRQWVFGPIPPKGEFPKFQMVRFVYRLEGPPLSVGVPPTIRIDLPDRVEIVTRPLRNDLHIEPVPGACQNQGQGREHGPAGGQRSGGGARRGPALKNSGK